MLGRLKMDVDECIKAYTGMFKDIFEKKKHAFSVNFRGNLQGKFDSDVLKESIKKIVESNRSSEKDLFNAKGERHCRV